MAAESAASAAKRARPQHAGCCRPCTHAGLPIGVQLVAAPGQEALLLRAAAAYEAAHAFHQLVPLQEPREPGQLGAGAAPLAAGARR